MDRATAATSPPAGPALSCARLLVLVAALAALGGCATYRPKPLTPAAVRAGLAPPDLKQARLQAGTLKHPLLPAVPFDLDNGLSPDEAAILAVLANPALRGVRDRRKIAAAQLLQAGILPNPSLSWELETPVGHGSRDKVNAMGFGLSWEFSSLISRSGRLDAARAHAASVDLAVAWQEWQVAEAARRHSWQLLLAGRQVRAARQAETALQRLRDALATGVALGVKTRLDLGPAETALRKATSRRLAAEATLSRERLALNRVLGLPAGRVLPLEKKLVPALPSCPPAKTLSQGLETRRLDLLALKLGYRSQEARLRAAVAAQFPGIHLDLGLRRDTDSLRTIGTGLGIDLPFFDRNQGGIARERASRQRLFDEYLARLFAARADIARLRSAIRANQRQAAAAEVALAGLRTRNEQCRQAAAAGQAEIFTCLRTLAALRRQRIRKIELEQKMVDLGIALEIASGRYGLVNETGPRTRKHALPVNTEALQ